MNDAGATPTESLPFLRGGGTMGVMMRAHDWSASPLGRPDTWPAPLRTVVDLMLNSKFPMFVAWGEELGFLYNDSYAAILGDKHPAALGQRFEQIWADIWDDILPLVERALNGEASYLDRLPLRMRRHGYEEDTWFRFSYSPVRQEDGVVAGMFCACVEMTGEVLAQRYRDEENQRLMTLFEQAPGIIAVLRGAEHVFELTNRSYQELVGKRDLVGKPVRAALPEVQGQGFFELLDQVYGSGEPFVGYAVPLRVQRAPGAPLEQRFIDFIYQPIRDQHDQVVGIFVEGSDVTVRKRVEDELRAANQQKDQFLAMLAHELRNPLAPITTAGHLLQRGQLDPAAARRASDIIVRQAEHMAALVNDLLDVSRVTRGLVTLARGVLDMREVVHEAVEQVRPLMDARGHRFDCDIPASLPAIDGDRMRLIQVLSNILNNAAKYTAPNGHIVLAAGVDDGCVRIAVRDNGQGIEPSMLPYIFDPFIQAERTPDRSQGGLGLGLALVRSLVQLHGGRVEARSEGAGQGSEFVLWLPCVQAAPSTPDEDGAAPARETTGMQVLVVDDNADAAQMLAALLEMHGYSAQVAYTGLDGLASAVDMRPDVALLDIGLPDIDGHELARRLRALPELSGAMLVALTGYGQEEDRQRAFAAGFDHHMAKPADIKKLLALLEQVESTRLTA